jgi:hypothetical protein
MMSMTLGATSGGRSAGRTRWRVATACLVVWLSGGLGHAWAQDEAEPELGWTNTTDLSLVVTEGNSTARTLGLANRLLHVWTDARFQLDIKAVRSDTSNDRFFAVDPGFEFAVGAAPANLTTSFVKPEPTQDVANYLVGGRYDQNITEKFLWNAGISWDRNEDAAILHRYVAFAGLGHVWTDDAQRRFATSYGLSYTDRVEEQPDPDKDLRFGGARLGWAYTEQLGAAGTTLESDLTTNINVADGSDFSVNTTNGVSVPLASHISLKVSVQLLFENQPAIETGLDVVAFVGLMDPDGVPGSGDERFRTLESGGTTLLLGAADARKDKLDTMVWTALVIEF